MVLGQDFKLAWVKMALIEANLESSVANKAASASLRIQPEGSDMLLYCLCIASNRAVKLTSAGLRVC